MFRIGQEHICAFWVCADTLKTGTKRRPQNNTFQDMIPVLITLSLENVTVLNDAVWKTADDLWFTA